MVDIVAKKRFGQNFLKDTSIIKQIVKSMPNDKLQIVEIGPGLGDLTEELLRHYSVIAYEVDIDLYRYLQDKFRLEIDEGKLTLKLCDVLEFWEDSSLCEKEYKIVANLPYNIGTNIILRALKDQNCKHITAMLQKEVALKFCAVAGEREYSALGVLRESVANARVLLEVPPTSFEPIPKVDSIVFEIDKFANIENNGFESFLRVAFNSPRKMALKNLTSLCSRDTLETLFDEIHLEKNYRPHQISSRYYHLIFEKLKKGDFYGKHTK